MFNHDSDHEVPRPDAWSEAALRIHVRQHYPCLSGPAEDYMVCLARDADISAQHAAELQADNNRLLDDKSDLVRRVLQLESKMLRLEAENTDLRQRLRVASGQTIELPRFGR